MNKRSARFIRELASNAARRAERDGAEARLGGKSIASNPYVGTHHDASWHWGWENADAHGANAAEFTRDIHRAWYWVSHS
jgi:ribosome modulation factor